ncbi:MAG: LysR family transcriptional regulator [Pseudomonadota bacterium]
MLRQLRFRDLEYFVAVAEHRSFAKAAEALCVSQPTLSNQIRRIEEALRIRAFRREGRSVRVTPEAARMLDHARAILGAVDEFERTVEGEDDFIGRRLALGAISTVAPYLGPPLLARLRRENAEGEIRFVEGLTEDLERRVASGELDCALTATPPGDPNLRERRIAVEGLVYVTTAPAAEGALASEGPDRPILLMQQGHCFRDLAYDVVARLKAARVGTVDHAITPASLSTLVGLVRSGAGDALLPAPFASALPEALSGLAVRPLPGDAFQRTLRLVMRASREHHVDMARLAAIAAELHGACVRAS